MAVVTVHAGALLYLAAEGIAAPHAFTTRLGGVSTGYLSSLNLGTGRGDAPENVRKNFEILGNAVGFSPENIVMACQTHSDIIHTAEASDRGAGLYAPKLSPCDALITQTPGLALMVSTADCTPVLLYDPETGAVGAAHAGWRGTAADIAGKTAREMAAQFGCRPENLRAAIGPNIGPCCFQTDADVPDAMRRTFGQAAEPFLRQAGEKYYVNLKELNALSLRRAGVTHIEISPVCTACEHTRFWSHRVTRGQRGSQGAIIVCKGGPA